MSSCQFVREQATTKSSSQVINLRRAFPGRQRGKRQSTLLTRKWKVVIERKVRKIRVRMKLMREERRERMMGTKVRLTGEPSKVQVQEALGMGIPIHLFSPKCGLSMTLSLR